MVSRDRINELRFNLWSKSTEDNDTLVINLKKYTSINSSMISFVNYTDTRDKIYKEMEGYFNYPPNRGPFVRVKVPDMTFIEGYPYHMDGVRGRLFIYNIKDGFTFDIPTFIPISGGIKGTAYTLQDLKREGVIRDIYDVKNLKSRLTIDTTLFFNTTDIRPFDGWGAPKGLVQAYLVCGFLSPVDSKVRDDEEEEVQVPAPPPPSSPLPSYSEVLASSIGRAVEVRGEEGEEMDFEGVDLSDLVGGDDGGWDPDA